MTAPQEITPFTIDVPQADLDDLGRRLAATRWPGDSPGPPWARGVPAGYLRELAGYWQDGYDWRARERELNAFPQFTTNVDGQRLHFMHVRSAVPGAMPLLLIHGWPGSVAEFTGIIGPLTDPQRHGGTAADAFHVVAPSLPGFAFSAPLSGGGWGVPRIAAAFAQLMSRLGYDRYGAQGGDWGSFISRQIGAADAGHVTGVHLNMMRETGERPADLTPGEQDRIATARYYAAELAGYNKVQSTRPQTLAYALTDSPVGQLAWIAEKFFEWTDSRDRPEDAVDRDVLLTNVMLYWLTATAGSAAQIYYEAAHGPQPAAQSATPTAVAVFPRDIHRPIRRMAERSDRIEQWTEMDRGGHFAAMEQPGLLVQDIRAFFRGRG